MALLAYNRTGDPITLVEGSPAAVLPPSASPPGRGPGVNVTTELRGLTEQQYADLAEQAASAIDYVWTGPPEYDTGVLLPAAPSTGSAVCWAPYMFPGPGYYTDFGDAVAAAQRLTGAKEIQILADPDDDNVYIPGGTWDMTGITLRGLAVGADWDTNNRGYQELLYVTCLGRIGRWSYDDNNPGTIADVTDSVVTFTVAAPWFELSKYVIGQYIEIVDADTVGNNGVFEITEVVDEYTVKFYNEAAVAPDANNDNLTWWIDNPTWLKNIAGMKDMSFRQSNYDSPDASEETGSISEVDGGWALFTKTGGYQFTSKDIGKPIRIGRVDPYYDDSGNCTDSNNDGTYIIVDVIDGDTIVYFNDNGPSVDDNNGNIHWSLCVSPVIFTTEEYGYYPYPMSVASDFRLDNVDFRYGGNYDWGSLYVLYSGDDDYQSAAFIHLLNGASIRWYSCTVDSYIVIQSDGSPCWLGSYALYGNGYADVYAMPGMEVHTDQDLDDWQLHQAYSVYIPSNSVDWDGNPETMSEALDRLAAACVAAGQTP